MTDVRTPAQLRVINNSLAPRAQKKCSVIECFKAQGVICRSAVWRPVTAWIDTRAIFLLDLRNEWCGLGSVET